MNNHQAISNWESPAGKYETAFVLLGPLPLYLVEGAMAPITAPGADQPWKSFMVKGAVAATLHNCRGGMESCYKGTSLIRNCPPSRSLQ